MKKAILFVCILLVVISLIYFLSDKPNEYNAYCQEQCLLISGEKNSDFQTPAQESCVRECEAYHKSVINKP